MTRATFCGNLHAYPDGRKAMYWGLQRGEVVFFDKRNRCGFIRPDCGTMPDVFFRATASGRFICRAGRPWIIPERIKVKKGDAVYFKPQSGERGLTAKAFGFASSYYEACIEGLSKAADPEAAALWHRRSVARTMMPNHIAATIFVG